MTQGWRQLRWPVVACIAVLTACGGSAPPAPAPSAVAADAGSLTYYDSFGQPADDWAVGDYQGGLQVSYQPGHGLVLQARSSYNHIEFAPQVVHGGVLVGAELALLPGDTSGATLAGPACFSTGGAGYYFALGHDGSWTISALPTTGHARVVASGRAPVALGSRSVRVEGACITGAGPTRLQMWVNTTQVASTTDSWSAVSGTAWAPAVVVTTGQGGAASVLQTLFFERTVG